MAAPIYTKLIFLYLALSILSVSKSVLEKPLDLINRFSISSLNYAFFAPNLNCHTYELANGNRETVDNLNAKSLKELIIVKGGITMLKTDEIFFDYNKSNIREDASEALDKLFETLNTNKSIIIRIEAHADSRGSHEYNLKLSEQRAKSSRDYLIKKGIHPDRIVSAKGFGETKLLNECGDGISCSEAAHQLNRRSEFIVLNP